MIKLSICVVYVCKDWSTLITLYKYSSLITLTLRNTQYFCAYNTAKVCKIIGKRV